MNTELVIFCEKCKNFSSHKKCDILGDEHKCCNTCNPTQSSCNLCSNKGFKIPQTLNNIIVNVAKAESAVETAASKYLE